MSEKSTNIAWVPEEAKVLRYIRRQQEKMKKKGELIMRCPNKECQRIEFGGKMYTTQMGMGGVITVPRRCANCGTPMIKAVLKE